MEYKHIKLHKDVWELIKQNASRLNMTIIDYMRYIAYKEHKKG